MARRVSVSLPLVFERAGAWWYARTPSGEYQFGPDSGLWEFQGQRLIGHGGRDQQIPDRHTVWQFGSRSWLTAAGGRWMQVADGYDYNNN